VFTDYYGIERSAAAWTAGAVEADGGLGVVPPSNCDLDGDGAVTIADVMLLLANWGACPPPPVACIGDVNSDGRVDAVDLLLLLSQFDT
jgi:hypothetical protein